MIAAFASVIGSVLTFIVGIRSIRRSVSTSNGEPLGRVLEARLDRMERRLEGMDRSIGDVRVAGLPRGKGAPAALDAPESLLKNRNRTSVR